MNTQNIIYVLDLVGVASFAFSGAVRAIRRRPDLVGVTVLAGATAVGGGMIRDALLGRGIGMLHDPFYPAVILASALITFAFPHTLTERETFFKYFDAFGLGIFSAIGATIAMQNNLNFLWVLFIAAITGAGGGVVRDVLLTEMPLVLYKEVYITAVAVGAAALWLGKTHLGLGEIEAFFLGMTITIAIRVTAIYRSWSLPRVRIATPSIK